MYQVCAKYPKVCSASPSHFPSHCLPGNHSSHRDALACLLLSQGGPAAAQRAARVAYIENSSSKEIKADSTLRSSQAVPHPSTDRALRRLTSEVERDPVHSTWYGRQQETLSSAARALRGRKIAHPSSECASTPQATSSHPPCPGGSASAPPSEPPEGGSMISSPCKRDFITMPTGDERMATPSSGK